MQFRSSKIGQVKQPALPQAEVTLAILYLGPGGAGRGRFNLTSPLRADLVSIFRKLIAFFRHIIGWDAEKTFDVSASTTRSSQLAERRGLIGGAAAIESCSKEKPACVHCRAYDCQESLERLYKFYSIKGLIDEAVRVTPRPELELQL